MRAITWNLSHGRDAPPDVTLRTWRSRLLRVTETNETHAQVNRSLREEFAAVLARDDWDVALLQEAPPRWLGPLCRSSGAHGVTALTSRNFGAAARGRLADRNPDLMASAEGGSNQLLVRPPWRVAEVRRLTLTRRPERRRMVWARLEASTGARLAVANLHATIGGRRASARDVQRAAEHATRWAGRDPLLFGGDLNLRPRTAGACFDRLRRRFGLAPATDADAVDHLFVRDLDVHGRPVRLRPEWREVAWGRGLSLRLSDHDPVALSFSAPARGARSRWWE